VTKGFKQFPQYALCCILFVFYYLCKIKQINTLTKNTSILQLRNGIKERESFSRKELFDYYRQSEPDLKESTFRWRIHQLKSNRQITVISRGLFTFSFKPAFEPAIGETEKKIYTKIDKQFPGARHCIWSTKIVNEFMHHIPGKFLTILQVEKDALEPIYEYLKEQNYKNVYIEPEQKEIERYIFETGSAIILQTLISKAPTQRIKKISTTTLEKMLVDLYCDKVLFNTFQDQELIYIINNAYNRYSIDFTKLFAYAKRRRKDIEIKEFLIDRTDLYSLISNWNTD
jgi:hypothetical protein